MPEITGLSKTAQDADFLRQVPFQQYEKVEVTFIKTDTDVPVTYSVIRPDNPNTVRFLDIGDKSVYTASTGAATPAHVYRTPVPWTTPGVLYVRSSAGSPTAPYTTTLLLFVERG